jgi:hypothetical protein
MMGRFFRPIKVNAWVSAVEPATYEKLRQLHGML